MKNKLLMLIVAVVLVSNFQVFGQNGTLYNFYNLQPIMLNPAAAGLNENPIVFFDYRKQWAGIQGSPEIASGSINGQIVKNMGAGLNFNSYKSSIFRSFSASFNYAYIVKISENQSFIPGVFIGLKQTTLNKESLTVNELADPALSSELYEKFLITSGFGARYRFKDLIVDFAIPNLYTGEDETIAQSMLGFVSYDFFTKDNLWRIQPSVLYRYEQSENSILDVSFLLEYNNVIWTQLGYRSNKDVNIMLGVNYKSIGIAYNYSITNSAMESVSGGSHEIAILYTIPFSLVK